MLIIVLLTCDHSNCQLAITTLHLPYPLNFVEGLPLLELSLPLLTSCATQKHVCVTWSYFHTLAEPFQVLVTEFFPTRPKMSGLFVAQYLFLIAHK